MRLFVLAVLLIGIAPAASASDGFNIVVPGRPGLPVIINGVDATYAVVEGEFGLGKGVNNQPTIYGGHFADVTPHVGHYYPSLGLKPGYGRLEIEPPANRKLPPRAASYHKTWSAESAPLPPTEQEPGVPLYPPPVIVAPPGGGPRGFGPRQFQTPNSRTLPN